MAEKEYIEKRKLIEAWEREIEYATDLRDAFDFALEDVPAADVAPIVHGEWEFRNDGRYGQTRCYCSVCGKHSGIGGIRENQMKPYCPNCGAKMDGERKEATP